MTVLTLPVDLTSARRYILETLERLNKGEVSVQEAAIVVKAMDVANRMYTNELIQSKLGLKSSEIKFI